MSDTYAPIKYVKIWGILIVLLAVSITGPMFEQPAVTLIAAFGIALVKASLVATYFMHLNVEKRYFRGAAALLGTCFVSFQGFEWLRLIAYGMTMTSGIFGACFFLLIGTHSLHAAAAAMAMVCLYRRVRRNELRSDHLQAMQVFWYFVVGIWPVLYGLVYF